MYKYSTISLKELLSELEKKVRSLVSAAKYLPLSPPTKLIQYISLLALVALMGFIGPMSLSAIARESSPAPLPLPLKEIAPHTIAAKAAPPTLDLLAIHTTTLPIPPLLTGDLINGERVYSMTIMTGTTVFTKDAMLWGWI